MTTFTHSLAQIAPYEKEDILGAQEILSYNRQPQYTSYNGDVYTTIGVVPSFFVQTTGSFTSSGLWFDYFGGDGIDTDGNIFTSSNSNIGLINANNFTDFNFIFDVYQLDERIPNLQDIYGYRYNQYEMYGINTYNAGKKIKNLGRYKVTPNPETGLGSLNISRVLKAHKKPQTTLAQGLQYPGSEVYESSDMSEKVRNLINKSDPNLYGNPLPWYRPDTENSIKWNIEYGFEVNPGLTFSDTVFSAGTYINPGTGLTASYSLGFTFSYPHYLKYGDEIIIQMDNLGLNPEYNGLCYVVDVVNPYHIVVDKGFIQASTNEGGSITYLLRANEISSGNWWKYVNSRFIQSDYYRGIYPLGFLNGRQITNFSINSTTQRNLNPAFNNFGQVGLMGTTLPDLLQKTVINDVSGLIADKFLFPNVRIEGDNYVWNTPRFFLSNWNDTYMGRKELNFYTWNTGTLRDAKIPNYTLGILSHQNYWPAYFRNFDFTPTEPGEKLSTVCTFNTLRYTWLSATGSVKAQYDKEFGDLMPNTITNYNNMPFDYEKFEMIMSGNDLWELQFNDVPLQDDILRVELIKKQIPGWTSSEYKNDFSSDFNVIMDFDGVDYNQFGSSTYISAYPFHYQWSDYYDAGCDNYASFKGPFGTLQQNGSSGNWDVTNYNFKQTSATVSVNDANWPYTPQAGPNNRGFWISEMVFQVNDPSCGFFPRINLLKFNELYTDGYMSDISGNEDLGYKHLPPGTYSIDYVVTQATQSSPDILGLIWNIGTGQTSLPLVVGTIYRDVEIYSPDGGEMWFEGQIDPGGSIKIRPLKIRHKSDIVLAQKEFKCNIICRGTNPYSIPLGKWDYGQPVELLFLNRLGSYERLYFELDSKRSVNIQRTNYNKTQIRDRWGLFNEKHSNTILAQKATEQYVINSNWLSQNKLTFYEELLTSPEVYVVQMPPSTSGGSTMSPNQGLPIEVYIPVLIQDTSFQNKTYLREQIFNLQLTIQMAFDINLQNQ